MVVIPMLREAGRDATEVTKVDLVGALNLDCIGI